jgi:hypothetical protein
LKFPSVSGDPQRAVEYEGRVHIADQGEGDRRKTKAERCSCDRLLRRDIQAIATTAPDLPPQPGVHATFARDHEYKRHGTVSLLAGIDYSAHISKETKTWLADQPVGRFEFTFTPTHGSWLNLIEGFFSPSSHARCCAHIRVASKEELKGRIMAAMDEFNHHPVVHTWSYK